MYKHILVATDGGPLSKKAIQTAIALCKTCKAKLTVLTVVSPYPLVYFEGAALPSMKEIEKVEAGWIASAQKIVDKACDAALKQEVTAQAVTVKSGSVADAIIATSKKNKCNLIVMASHGRKGLKRILLGSETQHVLTHSTTPVLVLR